MMFTYISLLLLSIVIFRNNNEFANANANAIQADTVQSLIPLNPKSDAFQRGNKASNVIVEFFIDLTCSSCLDSWLLLLYIYIYLKLFEIFFIIIRSVLNKVVSTYGISFYILINY